MPLLEKCLGIVNLEIASDFRKEATEILKNANKNRLKEFYSYFKKRQMNISCLVLDVTKKELVKEGKMMQKSDDSFGKDFI